MRWTRRMLAASALAGAVVLGIGISPALAESPPAVTDVVTDTTGSIPTSRVGDVEKAAQRLREAQGIGYYVVVVDRFSNPSDGFDWATKVAERSGLGTEDIILYVGMDVGDFGLNVPSEVPLSNSQISRIQTNDIKPALDGGDVTAAAVAGAEGLLSELGGGAATADDRAQTSTTSGKATPFRAIGAFVLLAVFAAVIVIVVIRRRRRKRNAANQVIEARKQRLQQASAQLVRLDNQLGTAEQDLAFAGAQFGDDAVREYAEVLADAKLRAQAAFGFQAKLLDHIPDSPQEQDEWTGQILNLTQVAAEQVQAQTQRLDELRGRQDNAPALLDALRGELSAGQADHTDLAVILGRLRDRFQPGALRSVDDDATQAERLLQLAAEETGNAERGLATGETGPAVIDIGDAEQALGQYRSLATRIRAAGTRLEGSSAEIAATANRIASALDRLQQLGTTSGATLDQARQALAEANAAGSTPADPLGLADRLLAAATAVESTLAAAVDAEQRRALARDQLGPALSAAQAELDAATSFIETRRGVVQAEARTRADQAEQELVRARSLSAEPEQALAAASRATELARRALALAQQDANAGYSAQVPGAYQGYGNHRQSGGNGYAELGGAILGGIIGGILSNGGSSRRHDNNGFGGMFGGGFSSGGFGSGFSSGGGGSRRGGGGGFGGGGFTSGGGGRRR